jgi:EmrB/QacA subfamily drug resistance transporter
MGENLPKVKNTLALLGLCLASLIGALDFTIINTALPSIQYNLHANIIELQWVINIFILALAAFMVISGKIADLYGRKRVLIIGLIIFSLSSLLAGCSYHIYMLIFFRFIQGASCTILYTSTGAIVSNIFPAHKKGQAMGILFTANALGLAIGPVLGGIIVYTLGWRWIFFLVIPVTFSSITICYCFIEESYVKHNNSRLDISGTIMIILAMSSLVLGLSQTSIWGWTSIKTIGLFLTSLLIGLLFYRFEKNKNNAVIDFNLLTNSQFIISSISNMSLAFFYCVTFFLLPLYLNLIKGYNDYFIGIMLLPITATMTIISPIVGRYCDSHNRLHPILLGFILFAISAVMQCNFTQGSSTLHIALPLILIGVGWACIPGPATLIAISSVPADMSGTALGATWTIHNLGGILGLGIMTTLVQTSTIGREDLIAIYKNSMILLSAVSIMTIILLGFMQLIKKSMAHNTTQ